MAQHYSRPSRESDPHALPDVETFYADRGMAVGDDWYEAGWYYWFCVPGCLPDSDPVDPFDTEAEALADVRENYGDDESELDDDQGDDYDGNRDMACDSCAACMINGVLCHEHGCPNVHAADTVCDDIEEDD